MTFFHLGAVNEVVKPIGNNGIIDGRMEISSPKDVMGREKQGTLVYCI